MSVLVLCTFLKLISNAMAGIKQVLNVFIFD